MAFIPFAFSRTLKHTRPRHLPQKEEDHPRQRMVEDISSRRNSALPQQKAYPQSALRLTASSAEGAFRHTPRKASPERGGAREAGGGVRSPRRTGRGGSVSRRDHNPKQENAPTSHGRTTPKESTSLFPATLRERGSGGEALLLEKRPLPQNLPQTVS